MSGENFYAGGFLYNPKTDSVLLHLRDSNTPFNPNRWAFFGGTSEPNETPRECFMRELEEEIGLRVEPKQIIYLCDYFNTDRNTQRHVFYVENDIDASKLSLGEGAGLDWISLKKLTEYDITEKTVSDLTFFVRERLC